MISKNKIKFIKSLEYKKHRQETGCFLAEGNKLVADLLPYFQCEFLLAKKEWLNTQKTIKAKEIIEAEIGEIEKVSLLKNPQDVIAVFTQPKYELDKEKLSSNLSLILDGIQDPGNLGTIIRIADWFGIKNIICSLDTADAYNPKTIQATMGAIARVEVSYRDLVDLLAGFENTSIYGTFLEGENIYTENLSSSGFIIMGNEGNGIRPEIEKKVNRRIHVPNFPVKEKTSESLNVAVATAIICSEFRRQQVYSI